MPYQANEPRRHKIPRARYKVINGPEHDKALQQRGSLTVWVTPEALAAWQPPRTGQRGRPRDYSDVAIETGHLLRLAFSRPWRQTEGLLRSTTALLGIDVGVPDHTTFSQRSPGLALAVLLAQAQASGPVHVVIDATGLKVYGAGEWLVAKHGERGVRTWRKLHVAVDPSTGEILASELTTSEKGDASQVGPLLGQIPGPIASVMADGAYDGEPVYRAVGRAPARPAYGGGHPAALNRGAERSRRHDPCAGLPSAAPTEPFWPAPPSQRDQHIQRIGDKERLGVAAQGSARDARGMAVEGGRRRSATASGRMRRPPCSATRSSSAAASAPGPCRSRKPRPRSPARC